MDGGQILVREREFLDQLLLDLLDRRLSSKPVEEPNDREVEIVLLELVGDHAPVPPTPAFPRFFPAAERGTMA